ncbi:hypothetical protein [Flavobacterium akiainvivens]|uniref:hypothetical protein n=1 Tax=Flavobacterium akiainvivens TaxID=1202724 RepID=UPI0011601939|nr:hypothetical protein [Flavobacterium akiainvivens]
MYYLLWIIFGITAISIAVFDKENSAVSRFWAAYFIVLLAIHIVFLLTRSKRYVVLKGRLDGKIVFYENRIAINGESIYLDEIEGLDFVFNDYKDKPIEVDYSKESDLLYDIKAKRLQGVDNCVEIILTSGKKVVCLFQRHYPNEKYFMADIFRAYYRQGKIGAGLAMELLGLENEGELKAV